MRHFIIYALLLIFPVEICFADMVYFKDGRPPLECEVTAQAPDQIGVKTQNNSYYIKKEEVDRIEFSEKKPELKPGFDWGLITFAGIGTVLCVLLYVLARAGNNY
jgi:hypothetical protein